EGSGWVPLRAGRLKKASCPECGQTPRVRQRTRGVCFVSTASSARNCLLGPHYKPYLIRQTSSNRGGCDRLAASPSLTGSCSSAPFLGWGKRNERLPEGPWNAIHANTPEQTPGSFADPGCPAPRHPASARGSF